MANPLAAIILRVLEENRVSILMDAGVHVDDIDLAEEDGTLSRIADECAAAIRSKGASDTMIDTAYTAWIARERRKTNKGYDRPEDSPRHGRNAFHAGVMLMLTGRGMPTVHPVVANALRLHDMDPEHICDTALRNGVFFDFDRGMRSGLPKVHVDCDGARVEWEWAGIEFQERLANGRREAPTSNEHIVRLRRPLPETVVASLAGRRMDEVAELPAGEGLIIREAAVEDGVVTLVLQPIEDSTMDADT